MTMGVAVTPKNGKFVVEFRFHDKNTVMVADSSEAMNTRGEAEKLAQTWSREYNAKIEF